MTELGLRSDEDLMANYVGGDRAAFAELFRRYEPRLVRLLARDVGRGDEARDLVQQTFLQVHRARKDFRQGAKLRPWLFTIALNLKRQLFRRRGRRPQVPMADIDDFAAAGGDPERRAADAQLRTLLRRLPDAQREVIVLHWFEGLSFREVAGAVGASESAVKVRAHRGYGKLREFVQVGVTGAAAAAYGERKL